jgi:hypothetical protein
MVYNLLSCRVRQFPNLKVSASDRLPALRPSMSLRSCNSLSILVAAAAYCQLYVRLEGIRNMLGALTFGDLVMEIG